MQLHKYWKIILNIYEAMQNTKTASMIPITKQQMILSYSNAYQLTFIMNIQNVLVYKHSCPLKQERGSHNTQNQGKILGSFSR